MSVLSWKSFTSLWRNTAALFKRPRDVADEQSDDDSVQRQTKRARLEHTNNRDRNLPSLPGAQQQPDMSTAPVVLDAAPSMSSSTIAPHEVRGGSAPATESNESNDASRRRPLQRAPLQPAQSAPSELTHSPQVHSQSPHVYQVHQVHQVPQVQQQTAGAIGSLATGRIAGKRRQRSHTPRSCAASSLPRRHSHATPTTVHEQNTAHILAHLRQIGSPLHVGSARPHNLGFFGRAKDFTGAPTPADTSDVLPAGSDKEGLHDVSCER